MNLNQEHLDNLGITKIVKLTCSRMTKEVQLRALCAILNLPFSRLKMGLERKGLSQDYIFNGVVFIEFDSHRAAECAVFSLNSYVLNGEPVTACLDTALGLDLDEKRLFPRACLAQREAVWPANAAGIANLYQTNHHIMQSRGLPLSLFSSLSLNLTKASPRAPYHRRSGEEKTACVWHERSQVLMDIRYFTQLPFGSVVVLVSHTHTRTHARLFSCLFPSLTFVCALREDRNLYETECEKPESERSLPDSVTEQEPWEHESDQMSFFFASLTDDGALPKLVQLVQERVASVEASTDQAQTGQQMSSNGDGSEEGGGRGKRPFVALSVEMAPLDFRSLSAKLVSRFHTSFLLMQVEMMEKLQPDSALLHLRLPWPPGDTAFFDGQVWIPPFASHTNVDMRVLTVRSQAGHRQSSGSAGPGTKFISSSGGIIKEIDVDDAEDGDEDDAEEGGGGGDGGGDDARPVKRRRKLGQAVYPFRPYNHLIHEEQMFYFNKVTRTDYHVHSLSASGLDRCWDCAAEIQILATYLGSDHGQQMTKLRGRFNSKMGIHLSATMESRAKERVTDRDRAPDPFAGLSKLEKEREQKRESELEHVAVLSRALTDIISHESASEILKT